jgi:hypothetical protein
MGGAAPGAGGRVRGRGRARHPLPGRASPLLVPLACSPQALHMHVVPLLPTGPAVVDVVGMGRVGDAARGGRLSAAGPAASARGAPALCTAGDCGSRR